MRFNGNFTVNPSSRARTGRGGADALLGKPISGFIRFINGTRGYRRKEIAFHLQDTYKVNDRLTLNLGVRYDNYLGWPWTEVADREYNFIRELGTVARVGSSDVPWRLARISHRFRETGLAGARNEIFMVWGRQRLSVGPP